MATVKEEEAATKAVNVRFKTDSPTCVGPVVLEVAGVDIARYTRAITINASAKDGAKVELDVCAREGLDITLPAEVTINIFPALEGWVDVTPIGDVIQNHVRIRARDKWEQQ